MNETDSVNIRGGRRLRLAPFCVFGIVNITPDSFYDGGTHNQCSAAIKHALMLAEQGANVLDLGAESSRPYAQELDAVTEQARLLPVLRTLCAQRATAVVGKDGEAVFPLLSIDTYKASTAALALKCGADIINDISACQYDQGLREVLAEYKPGYVLMHSPDRPKTMQIEPHYNNIVDEVYAFFERHMEELVRYGLPEANVMLDVGIGFGKHFEHNCTLLRSMERFASLGRPLLLGISNKSFFKDLLSLPVDERNGATHIVTALLAARGVRCHRVHDVLGALNALKILHAIRPESTTNFFSS